MKLENQVVSLELAKELKELGTPQNSIFYWRKYQLCKNFDLYYIPKKEMELVILSGKLEENYSAFTVAELGKVLPIEYISQRRPSGSIGAKEYKWCAGKYDEDYKICENTESNARAKMLIYLLKNKLITL